MFTEKQVVLIKGSIARNKLLIGIEEAVLAREYEKIFPKNFSKLIQKKFVSRAKRGMKEINVTVHKNTIMLGFSSFEMEHNFLTEEEIIDLKRFCLFKKLIFLKEEEEKVLDKVFKKFPVDSASLLY